MVFHWSLSNKSPQISRTLLCIIIIIIIIIIIYLKPKTDFSIK